MAQNCSYFFGPGTADPTGGKPTVAIMNLLQRSKILMVAEGLNLFKVPVPAVLAGRTIAESSIREETGCSVVAIHTERGMEVVPNPTKVLVSGADIVLIGTVEAEDQFLELYGGHESAPRNRRRGRSPRPNK